ncbi:MAG: GspH/FimT family pseudopilin [Candidatus Electrothrix sp. GW3-4]|uniref:GspH/FimT family pseudopilin n=1 Tax=Candidatus Electrothrix sp. GW3-4 TaxID=3126740 RepID=UPI0030D0FDBF
MRIKNDIRSQQGFTFAELMIVIAIIGILSAIGIPSFLHSLPEKRLKNAARNLYADLQKVRLLAVKENKNVIITFNTAAGTYSYNQDGVTKNVTLGDYGAVAYDCGLTDKDWRNPRVDIPLTGVTGNVTFTRLGESLNGEADVYLQSQNDDTVCYAVNVSRFGAVKIWRYTSDTDWK